jgi:sucrose phosphorylase
MKSNEDGTESPYELNITYFDAITAPQVTAEQPEVAVQRFIVSQAIMLSVIGIPGIFFHSLFGSRNYQAGVQATGRNRTINREKLNDDTLLSEINREGTIHHAVFERYAQLLDVRTHEPAFHPLGTQAVRDVSPAVFAVERASPDEKSRLLALHNVSGQPQQVSLPISGDWIDLFDQASVDVNKPILLSPYQFRWLKAI